MNSINFTLRLRRKFGLDRHFKNPFMKTICFLFPICMFLLCSTISATGQVIISNQPAAKVIVFGNSKLTLKLDYMLKCVITRMEVNGEQVVSENEGIFSEIKTPEATWSTLKLSESPVVTATKNKVKISNISYGDTKSRVNETWTFSITAADIELSVERKIANPFVAEEVSFPSVNFKNMNTWDGAFTDFGGVAWFYLFNDKPCTYGVHSASAVFWNSTTGNGLRIAATSPGKQIVSKFTRSDKDELVYALSVSDNELNFRYDHDTKRRRFVKGKTDIWDSFTVSSGNYTESVRFSWLNYHKEYNRGTLSGLNSTQVTNLLNTIARIGVIDAKLFGGNSWHTPYGPICLHEQYIAQAGIAINDPDYLKGYKQCLDFYRDKAIQPDGRVYSRWAYMNIDAMPEKITPDGFYEAQWGYLLDSNPDFVTNVSELYNQNGDLDWVRTHKETCEKALDYLLKRDSNSNHLVEMMTCDHSEKRGSDWIDIIWASYENAFVNAKLYYALTLWASVEKQLGDSLKSAYYSSFAASLKKSFNRSTSEGGFWEDKNKWYVHWLDKDKSVHGNNLVVPVNFMAVAYGICDNDLKRTAILDKIEEQMQKEKLFAWPLCMYSYAAGEGNDWQFPFPNYENGDIFLSWGAVGVEAYAGYKPDLALQYIENILSRYEKDGLAFQRYTRVTREGAGDDILAGNSLAITGLYKSIYGINPHYNRMYINPHLPDKLEGTKLNYNFRNDKLIISLDKGRYAVSNQQFKVTSSADFGFYAGKNELQYFNSNSDTYSLNAKPASAGNLALEIVRWNENEMYWNQVVSGNEGVISYTACSLKPGSKYTLSVNGRIVRSQITSNEGILKFDINSETSEIRIRLH